MKNNKKYSLEVIIVGEKLLKTTCRKIIERSRCKDGAYKEVKCSFKSANQLFLSVKFNSKEFYEKWMEQTIIYMESGKDLSLRPTFDRIDEKGHYYKNNLQVLSYGKNSSKARKKR